MATIQDFYSGRSVFLTGASGFLGKQVLEKLLRSCNVKKVYVLVRPKKGKTSQERKEELLKSKLFSTLKITHPQFPSQVILIASEMTSPGMGLSEEDKEMLREEVSIIIHSAASVNFMEKLRDAVVINVIALRDMLTFAKTLPKLESFVHISTAYVNCHKEFSSECIVKPLHDPHVIIDMIKQNTEDSLEAQAEKIIRPWPNTYTFTKCLAEWLLREEVDNLPVCIFRPSIIGASAEEPCRGWVDNFNAATGVCLGAGAGMLSSIYGDQNLKADIVPVDLCANAIIALGWSTAVERSSKLQVFNFTSGQLNPVKWGDFVHWVPTYFNRCPLEAGTGYSTCRFQTSRLRHLWSVYGQDRMKMVFLDILLRVKGKSPKLVRLHKRALKGAGVLEFFTSNEWNFESENIGAFLKKISADDRLKFNFDIKTVKWPEYLIHYCEGIKEYAMKESMSLASIEKARTIQNRLEWIGRSYKLTIVSFVVALVWRKLQQRRVYAFVSYLLMMMRKLTAIKA